MFNTLSRALIVMFGLLVKSNVQARIGADVPFLADMAITFSTILVTLILADVYLSAMSGWAKTFKRRD
jgi:hypothetical protein